MEKSNDNSTSQLTRARASSGAGKTRTQQTDECIAGKHSPSSTAITRLPLPSAFQSSHSGDPSSLAADRKRVPSGSILRQPDCISENDNLAHAQPESRRQTRQHRLSSSSSSSIQSTASTSSELLRDPEGVVRAREYIDNDLYYYHPQFAPYTTVTQRHSWPVIASTPSFFQRYPDHIEALDIPSGVSSVDSGIDLPEYSPWDALDIAYIGGWSN